MVDELLSHLDFHVELSHRLVVLDVEILSIEERHGVRVVRDKECLDLLLRRIGLVLA